MLPVIASSFLVALSVLSLPATSLATHGRSPLLDRHSARSSHISIPRHPLVKRGPVRCPSKVTGAKLLVSTTELSVNTVNLVAQNAANVVYSWEFGTYQTALLELNAPELFLYNGSNAIPPTLTSDSDVTKLFASVDAVLAAKPAGIKPFFSDKAVGDPASVGIPFLIRNWTLTTGSTKYATAASQQLDYLLNDVDRTDNGAISQRTNVVQVWADFMTMAPPFIAYYGAITNNYATLLEGYTQLADYHDILFDSSAGMMQHILLGTSSIDTGHWGTGNGWACHGMLRVLRTIQLSNYANSLKSQQSDLLGWVSTILTNVWKHQQSSGALLNYIDGSTSSSSVFPDASGTALLAAATFRLASLVYGTSNAPTVNIAAAEKARVWVVQQVGADGWLKNGTMVDPYNWHQSGSRSPEAHSFVLMLTAAYRDWQSATKGYYN